jgi:hypothetical protein
MLNLTTVMIYSEDPAPLNAFYTKVLGEPAWEDSGFVGWQAGNSTLMTGPHSEVKGRNEMPGRIIVNFETPDVKGEFERIKALGAKVEQELYAPGEEGGDVARHIRGPGRQLLPARDADAGAVEPSDPATAEQRTGWARRPSPFGGSPLRALRSPTETSSVRPVGAREVGDLVGFCRSPGKASGGGPPQPARDGSAASHLEGRLRFMQVGPPPSSRAPIVQRAGEMDNGAGTRTAAPLQARCSTFPAGTETSRRREPDGS